MPSENRDPQDTQTEQILPCLKGEGDAGYLVEVTGDGSVGDPRRTSGEERDWDRR